MRLLMFLLILLCLPVAGISGQSALRDPRIPDSEESSYITRIDGEVSYSRTVVQVMEDENAYEFRNSDQDSESVLVVSRRGLVPIRGEVFTKTDSVEFTELTTVQRPPRLGRDVILLLSFDNIPYLLRGYPFSNPRTLEISTLSPESGSEGADAGSEGEGGSGEDFSIQIEYRGRETISANRVSYGAYKLELVFKLPGIAAIFAGAIPKTFLWYEAKAPYRLLRHEGPTDFNFGGEQMTFVTELLSSRIRERN